MATKVLMPKLGESVVEGTVSKWLRREGEALEKFEPLLEVSTDKVDTEVPCPAAGVLLRILVAEGETVAAGSVLALIGEPGESRDETAAVREAPAPATGRTIQDLGFISPVVARLAAEHNIDLSQVVGTGLNARIRKQDVLAYLERSGEAPPAGDATPAAAAVDSGRVAQPGSISADEVIPLTRMRRLIAEHMSRSKRVSPHVTTVFDCDMTAVVKHRYANQADFARSGISLTFTPYFVAAVAGALKSHPLANSTWSDEGLILRRDINIGLAVALDDGLITPVIKHADSLNLLGLARAVNDLSQRARSGDLNPDDIQDGTFTITNHGGRGSLLATPIINQPQAGILGVGRIHKEPVVVSRGHPLLPDAEDAIEIRPVAYLSFTFDHRILDGAVADAFMTAVKQRLEDWDGLGGN